jgi:hypothetical protein
MRTHQSEGRLAILDGRLWLCELRLCRTSAHQGQERQEVSNAWFFHDEFLGLRSMNINEL